MGTSSTRRDMITCRDLEEMTAEEFVKAEKMFLLCWRKGFLNF